MTRAGRNWSRHCPGLLLALALAAGCSGGDGEDADAGSGTDAGLRDGASGELRLYGCTTPGMACNAHDPCAINPVCGKDNLCRASSYMNCSDDLDCTTDTCAGSGLCSNVAKDGWCALLVKEKGATSSVMKCLQSAAVNPQDPCQECNPSLDKSKWSSRSGGSCDDGELCTKNDVCTAGTCRGTSYGSQCSDSLDCTQDLCDGKGGCTNKLRTDSCLISKVCYKDGTADTSGCGACDVTQSQTAWTARASICKIGTLCFKSGTADTSGCGVCDPTKSATAWSATPGRCLIDGSCLKSGDADATGCATCDPTKSTTSYTPASGKCLIADTCHAQGQTSASGCGSCQSAQSAVWWTPVTGASKATSTFESGLGSVTVTSAVDGVGWQVSTKRARGGSQSLGYGSSGGTYDNKKANSGTATLGTFSLPSGQKAALHFWVYLDIEPASTADTLVLAAGTSTLWSKSAVPQSRYGRWVPVEVDLSSLAGQSVTLKLTFDTKDAWANAGEGVYLDDVTVLTNCGQ